MLPHTPLIDREKLYEKISQMLDLRQLFPIYFVGNFFLHLGVSMVRTSLRYKQSIQKHCHYT